MGKTEDEKYTSETDRDSQVRNIINQLNAEHPSREKKREVVVRADGTKAIRVVKKRKVMVTREEKQRRGRRQFVYGLLVVLLLLGGLTGVLAFRFSQFSSREYYDKLSENICHALGAQRVQLVGAELQGLELKVANVIAEFPEGMMVERLEMSELSCELAASSFFTGRLKTEELKIGRTMLTIPTTARKVSVPSWQGEEIWHIKRMQCADFSCVYGAANAAAVAIQHSRAYLYFPGRSEDSRVLTLEGGTFRMNGWRPTEILSGRAYISPLAIENIRLRLTPDVARQQDKHSASYLEIAGHLMDNAALDSPLELKSDGIEFSDFSMGRFDRVISARTQDNEEEKAVATGTIVLPFCAERPEFSGRFWLRDVKVATLPALMAMMEHIEPVKRKAYLPLKLSRARVDFTHNGGDLRLTFEEGDFTEMDLISMSGDITVNSANEISGSLNYGIPSLLTYVEYPDGNSDPLFRDDGSTAWVSTRLSGAANAPTDNINELEAAADVARRDRPARTPFENIDVDAFAEKVAADMPAGETPMPEPAAEDTPQQEAPTPSAKPNNSGNPFEQKQDDPFAPSPNPFGGAAMPQDGGLLGPVDSSIFPIAK